MIKLHKYAYLLVFILLAGIIFLANAFPSLYGDEYGSLNESTYLGSNMHAIGYFAQLKIWRSISDTDFFLRLLSLLQFSAGMYFLHQWFKISKENIKHTTNFAWWLLALNSFIWEYGVQIRFYSLFFASSIFFAWRALCWQQEKSRRNLIWLAVAVAFLFTSHILSLLFAATMVFYMIWENIKNPKTKVVLAAVAMLGIVLVFVPAIRNPLVDALMQITNAHSSAGTARGISLAILSKIPFTFYFFALGERVYPLWWWITVPAMLIVGTAFLLGLWNIRKLGELGTLSVFMLLNVPLMYLVLDPLAPPSLQGAAPRYLIFVVPFLLLLLAHGAETWQPLKPALLLVSLAGMYCLIFPSWSYGGSDLINWQRLLQQAIPAPEKTCIITDGRAQAPVTRYAPREAYAAYQGKLADCQGYDTIVLVSNDYRLDMVRYFDDMSVELQKGYRLVSNITQFPAQVTVYTKGVTANDTPPPARLDLPEQDLQFPLQPTLLHQPLTGFARLDQARRSLTLSARGTAPRAVWIVTNYFAGGQQLPTGEPIFQVSLNNQPAFILHAGEETAAWDGACQNCVDVYHWTKRAHLVGSYYYPGAYRQHQAHIWGYALPGTPAVESVTISFLPTQGNGYFYGIFPQP